MMLEVLSKSQSYVSCTIGLQRLPFVTNVILSKWDFAGVGKNRNRRNGRREIVELDIDAVGGGGLWRRIRSRD